MTDDKMHGVHSAKEDKLRQYHPPQLLVFGHIKDLTAGGTGTNVETMQIMNKNWRV